MNLENKCEYAKIQKEGRSGETILCLKYDFERYCVAVRMYNSGHRYPEFSIDVNKQLYCQDYKQRGNSND